MSRMIPQELCSRLSKLLPMLSSDKEGEIVAAAGAITRTLTSAGFDWHDLTNRLSMPTPQQEVSPPPPQRGKPNPASAKQAIDSDTIEPLIGSIRNSGCFLSKNARGFLEGLEERARLYGMVHFTEKQWSWFLDLLESASVEMAQDMEDVPF